MNQIRPELNTKNGPISDSEQVPGPHHPDPQGPAQGPENRRMEDSQRFFIPVRELDDERDHTEALGPPSVPELQVQHMGGREDAAGGGPVSVDTFAGGEGERGHGYFEAAVLSGHDGGGDGDGSRLVLLSLDNWI